MFRKLGIFGSGPDEQELQVITKVQEYVLPPKAKYTGRWHTEGFTERIVAAEVYYLDIFGHGGDLVFRPPTTPGDGYDRCVHKYIPRDEHAFSCEHPFGSDEGHEFLGKQRKERKMDSEQDNKAVVAAKIFENIEKFLVSSSSSSNDEITIQKKPVESLIEMSLEKSILTVREQSSNTRCRKDTTRDK